MSVVAVTGLEFGYAATQVLRGVDLSVEQGTLVSVIGPSGCGKTTLLRLLAGFERSAAGRIEIGGTRVSDPSTFVPAHRRRVGVVPQEGALFPQLRVCDNIGFGIPRQHPGRDQRVAELLMLTDLEGLGTRYPRELSGGQQQRVALARALAPRPDVVLMDEPFASLDAGTRLSVRRSVREVLAKERVTAMIVTHDREEALSLADRVAVMVDGRIVQSGAPCEVYDAPRDRQVAKLLGEVNLVPVSRRDDGTAHCALGDLRIAGGTENGRLAVVRPEQVALDPDGMPAVVEEADFVGPSTRTGVRLGDGTPVVVHLTGDRPLVGETIRLALAGPVHLVE